MDMSAKDPSIYFQGDGGIEMKLYFVVIMLYITIVV